MGVGVVAVLAAELRVVSQGREKEGFPLFNEAMAGSLGGEGGSFDTVVFTSCNMIGSCARSARFERAVEWIRSADRFTRRYGCPFLFLFCRTLYGEVLIASGDWVQAEEELQIAVKESEASQARVHTMRWPPSPGFASCRADSTKRRP